MKGRRKSSGKLRLSVAVSSKPQHLTEDPRPTTQDLPGRPSARLDSAGL
jgi:hypothetical protein